MILAEEQAGRRTMEQIFNSQTKKHLYHGKDLYHNFTDFKKAFDRVRHEGLWNVMCSLNVQEGLVRTIKVLCDGSRSSVLSSNAEGYLIPATVGVRQG